MTEKLLQQIWKEQNFSKNKLRVIDGRKISIIKPGVSNEDEGADFLRAEIIIDDKLQTGNVEIHVKSSEWYNHEHHLQPEYDDVILHVVFTDDDINLRTKTFSGKRIPVFVLEDYLQEPIERLEVQINQAHIEEISKGKCAVESIDLEPDQLVSLLDQLGQERFMQKIEDFELRLESNDIEQVTYEGIMDALGYSKNREQFRELAQRIPFTKLAGKPAEEIQAILFGVAGLLPSQGQSISKKKFGQATQEYVERLELAWANSDEFNLPTRMHKKQWQFFRLRPSNFPTVRIAAISHILTKCHEASLLLLFLPIIEKASNSSVEIDAVYKQLWDVLMPETSGYWSRHTTFGGKPRKKPRQHLIGQNRSKDIVVNIILSVVSIWAERVQSSQLATATQLLYDNHPKLQENEITRDVKKKICGKDIALARKIDCAKYQQGSIYLQKTFCANRICDICPIWTIFQEVDHENRI